jgi:hypothetical protein
MPDYLSEVFTYGVSSSEEKNREVEEIDVVPKVDFEDFLSVI